MGELSDRPWARCSPGRSARLGEVDLGGGGLTLGLGALAAPPALVGLAVRRGLPVLILELRVVIVVVVVVRVGAGLARVELVEHGADDPRPRVLQLVLGL